ncbi:myozenin-3 isoform X1 [Centrocercus urophasianus]|uniref:myozenin-3 isoform X1 n=2 Tax=Tetraoninae TaxID=466585 RepID=UPI001C64C738|nr:myozenin-3 isoform X1 [Centrocercus urophasianus]
MAIFLLQSSSSHSSAPGTWQQAMTIMKPDPGDAPELDLGKKMSTPQDVMLEELSLSTNRGSQLFQQRQKRMQRFVLEHPSGYRKPPGPAGSHGTERGEGAANEWTAGNAEGQQSFHSELHVAVSPHGGPPEVPKKTEKVLHMIKVLNPDSLAPGYSTPLKEVPPEKFNVTAIPKGYRSPWHGHMGDKDKAVGIESQLPMKLPYGDFVNFNRTPTPFDKAQLSDLFYVPPAELDLSILEVIARRPNFNRVPQGWARVLPESDEL